MAVYALRFGKGFVNIMLILAHYALALLALVHPGVPAVVSQKATVEPTLRAETRVTLWTAGDVHCRVLTVTHHPSAHHQPCLWGENKQI